MAAKNNKRISHTTFLKADMDTRKAASIAHLSYVNDRDQGIMRRKKGNRYAYFLGNKKITDEQHLERIRKMAIPPSWKDVWICRSSNGHIQATGIDLRGRKQYRYHHKWNEIRKKTKFHHLYEFGKKLPAIRRKIKKDIAAKGLSRDKVLATVINLMDKTYIRIGNNDYEKMNGSYGLTTMKDRHVNISQDRIVFSFTGKKGIDHTVRLTDKKLAHIVKQCKDIPGKSLFQYYDEAGRQRPVDSGMVNNYIRKATGMECSAKDFRTWAGSVQAVEYFRSCGDLVPGNAKENILHMLDEVSAKLGNSRNICKKYYVHPRLIALCEENKLTPELLTPEGKKRSTFTAGEHVLMCILEKL